MAYYPDLSPYCYAEAEDSLNIGWLEAPHAFPTGVPSEQFLSCLLEFCKNPVNLMKGMHECQFCDLTYVQTHGDCHGNGEIRIQGLDNIIYAAPRLIFHYVEKHHYLPPKQFIDAVISCDPDWNQKSSKHGDF
jgi:hypothetical protein